MTTLIGRTKEQRLLTDTLHSTEAELIAVYGRRRVGKTFLIREFFKDKILFEFSGQHNRSLKSQLQNFSFQLDQSIKSPFPSIPPANWTEAFGRLITYLESRLTDEKMVVFFDEFPWIETPRSGFLAAFDYFWNNWAMQKKNLNVIICGSAASWMIRRVIQHRGGLHNRVTRKINLLPFTFQETEQFFKSRAIYLDRYQITQLYMTFGGIPHYLKEVKRGQSIAQIINEVCFTESGLLYDEFEQLYRSLFQDYTVHIEIVKLLAAKPSGLNRNEIIEKAGLSSGGTTTQLLEELNASGFVSVFVPFGKNQKELVYKLSDEYSLFYLKFMAKKQFRGEDVWHQLSQSASYKSWSGLAFETLCLKHIASIKRALGIAGVYTEVSVWQHKANELEKGAQIDLLIDRKDHTINVCEIKFYDSTVGIDKKYAEEIQQKLSVFKQKTQTKKTLFFTMITPYGVQDNEYKTRWVDSSLTIDDLFD